MSIGWIQVQPFYMKSFQSDWAVKLIIWARAATRTSTARIWPLRRAELHLQQYLVVVMNLAPGMWCHPAPLALGMPSPWVSSFSQLSVPAGYFLAFILILGNMNEVNQAGMQWSHTHTDRIPIKWGREIIIDLLPTPSSTFLFFLCLLLPFLCDTLGLNRRVELCCVGVVRSVSHTHTFRGKRPHAVSLKTLTVWAVNQTPLLPYAERKVWHHPHENYFLSDRPKHSFISSTSSLHRGKHAGPASIAVATEIRQFNAVYKAYSESFRKNKE